MTPGSPYRVDYSGSMRDQLKKLLVKADQTGVLDRVRSTIREIEGHLELHPTMWGDPAYRLHKMELTVYTRVFREMLVFYGVHDTENTVWLTRIRPVLGHPLRALDDD